jgi:Fe-S-cluster containining protein
MELTMSDLCKECGAKCCRYFSFEIDEPETFEEFEDVRWYLFHQGVSVHVDEGEWYISIDNKCNMLGQDNACEGYDKRPLICRKYAMVNCDHTGGDYGYDELFTSPEQLDEYAWKTLGKRNYQKQRSRALQRAERDYKLAREKDEQK